MEIQQIDKVWAELFPSYDDPRINDYTDYSDIVIDDRGVKHISVRYIPETYDLVGDVWLLSIPF